MIRLLTVASLLLIGCSDSSVKKGSQSDASRVLFIQDAALDYGPDLYLIDFTFPDAYVDPCLNATSSSDNFCECQPQCCQTQQWYCPPSGLGINALDVVMNICDDNYEPCNRSENFNCPPPEVLSQGSCRSILECPPNLHNDITITVRCEIEGVEGTQRIICSKGNIQYGECITCTPSEERCNYTDDDCDGQVDEDQRNACDACGPLPSEVCDGIDNDCDGITDEQLVQACETPCERGIETCSEGNWISCTATRPQDEECDGADNDCDGQVDEELNCLCDVEDVGNLQPCTEPPLRCGQGFKMCDCVDPDCTELRMTDCLAFCNYFPNPDEQCDPFLGMALVREECNAFDEDCDQLLDENLVQACYTADPETLGVGVCQPGSVYCDLGTWGSDIEGVFTPGFCDGEVTPSDEVCDGADNDCDGEIDYGEEIRDTDILFVVDWSGSMDDEIEAVRVALNQFAQQFSAEEAMQWGLIIGPKEFQPGHNSPEWLVKVSDISPFEDFLASFAALGTDGMDTGDEMLKDALYFSIQNISANTPYDILSANWIPRTNSVPEKEDFTITWRPNSARIIILFSDEEPQTFLSPSLSDATLVGALRAAVNTKLYAFVDQGSDGDEWEEFILAGNGQRFDLTSDANRMYNDLVSIIDEACLPRENQQASLLIPLYEFTSHEHPSYDYERKLCY
tara:strand:+ start:1542 stop:3590 length:2049 start_codon:yes stop_codon:yes gene_type:complete